MTLLIVSQIIIAITLLLMVIDKTPMFITAVVGAAAAAFFAGIPLSGSDPVTMSKLLISGLNPVLIDMCGILLFIGIMKASGFLNVIIGDVIRAGNYVGGGPGIITAASLVAGVIGMMVGFTQAAITGVVAGPAAIKLGVDPDEAAGALQHANNLGYGAGFAHPTMVSILAITGIEFGMFNVWGAVSALAVIGMGYWRMRKHLRNKGSLKRYSPEEIQTLLASLTDENTRVDVSSFKAFLPFIILIVASSCGIPIFVVCFVCSLLVIILSGRNWEQSQSDMIEGVKMIAVPFTATVVFLFLSGVIKNIGFVALLDSWFKPVLSFSPELVMFFVASLTGLITQSYMASAAVVLPFCTIALGAGGDPMGIAVAAASDCNIGQYYLTGGPVSGLNTVIPVVPGSDLVKANLFQRPNIAFGFLVGTLVVAYLAVI